MIYGSAKQANILFTVEATKRWPEIVSVAYHPGVVRTRFGHESAIYGFFYRWAPGCARRSAVPARWSGWPPWTGSS
jgi:NAD(P)-dependent dehydrogenase (short-subunit alcohol dehydrogenase family)